MPFVFVYGTLMRDGCRAEALTAEQFVGPAQTEPRYRLYDCGDYPGLVAAVEGRVIAGEVWRVSPACLVRLDEIEGVPEGWYARRPVVLQAPHAGECIDAYFYLHDVTKLPDAGNRWANR